MLPTSQAPTRPQVFKCPLCVWKHVEPAVIVDLQQLAAHGQSYANAEEASKRQRVDKILRDHFRSHSLDQWARAASAARLFESGLRFFEHMRVVPEGMGDDSLALKDVRASGVVTLGYLRSQREADEFNLAFERVRALLRARVSVDEPS